MTPVDLPAAVLAMGARSPEWQAWVDRLPALVGEVIGGWSLVLDGPAMHGHASVVLPVRDADGRPAVLKAGFPDPDVEHEHLALRDWDGRGACRLLRADPRRHVLLLERLGDEDLSERWDQEACEVVAGLYAALHVPAAPQLRRLSVSAARWAEELAALPRSAPLPRRYVEQAASLARDLAADPATDGTTVHGDLHYANVLAAGADEGRGPWLAIDPQPRSGDPHFEPAPMLWNRFDEYSWPGSVGVREGVRHRFRTLVDAAGLDEDRARAWVVVRMLVNALWRLQDPPGRVRVTPTDQWLTLCVAVAKAVQD